MKSTALVRRSDDADELNLTPLLDVVFIMLIFFIVTASFDRETGLDVSASGNSVVETRAEAEIVLIEIGADDRLWIEGREYGRGGLIAMLTRLHAENPDFPVVVRPASDSSAEALVRAIDSARNAGIDAVSIAEEPPDRRD